MYSPEFMKFLINYQTPEYNENAHKEIKTLKFHGGCRKLAAVFLTVKR